MSNRYKGGVISATPPTTTGGESGTASGAWTLEQQMQLQAAGLWPAQPTGPWIEQVFSTYLYTGNQTNRSIVNNIDLSTKGGMVWIKTRSTGGLWSIVVDTNRGATPILNTTSTAAASNASSTQVTSFNTDGFSLGTDSGNYGSNGPSYLIASWTFRKQAKFFDVVTYTGNGTAGRTIAHNLGSVPGCIIVKAYSVDTGDYWGVYHRSLGATKAIFLSATNAAATSSTYWNNTEPTSTNFTVGDWSGVNQNGTSYVAYIFAHDAGGFGLTGTDNVISCGSFTTSGAGLGSVTLGYEPQWVLLKRTSSTADWYIADIMRGWNTAEYATTLNPNLTDAESSAQQATSINATGFTANGPSSATYIYIAIRRGPMRTPTVGTSVFTPVARAGTSAIASVNTGIVTDAVWETGRSGQTNFAYDRLRGPNTEMSFTSTNAESSYTATGTLTGFDSMTGFTVGADASSYINGSGINYINWAFQRAPSFFDEVCYTGTGSARTVAHNLAVVPQLIICKRRDTGGYDWITYCAFLNGGVTPQDWWVKINGATQQFNTGAYWNSTAPTSSVFTVNTAGDVNGSGGTYVAYLFATCPGVSKVGSYTGTATTLQIDCGFTAGSRFVLIKRTDSTGDWYVWDSARGIIPSNDPYLLLNSTAAEVTGTDYIDTTSVGFDVTSTAPAAINANGGTYIFLAIA